MGKKCALGTHRQTIKAFGTRDMQQALAVLELHAQIDAASQHASGQLEVAIHARLVEHFGVVLLIRAGCIHRREKTESRL